MKRVIPFLLLFMLIASGIAQVPPGLTRGTADRLYAIRPRNPYIAGLGDSITNQNGTGIAISARGFIAQACALSGQRAVFLPSMNFGVSGETSPQIAARVGQVLAAQPGACVVLAGTNDLGYLQTMTAEQVYAQITTNLRRIYDALDGNRIMCFAVPILPRSAWPGGYTSDQITSAAQIALRVNAWIERQALTRSPDRWRLVRSHIPVTNVDSTSYGIISGATVDNIHPGAYGAYLIGQPLAEAIHEYFPKRPPVLYSRTDVRSASNPYGNIAVNGIMRGTSGTASTGTSGSMADGWGIARTTGSTLTATLTKESRANSASVQVIALSSGGGGAAVEALTISQTINAGASTFSAGETVRAEFEVEQTGLSNVLGISVYAQESNGATNLDYYAFMADTGTGAAEPAEADRVFRSVDFTVRPYAGIGTQRITLYVQIFVKCDSGTVGGSFKIRQISLRKLPGLSASTALNHFAFAI